MKRTLLASAVAAAVGVGPSLANADVILYGHAHGATGWIDDGADRSNSSNMFVGNVNSRIGVRGAEDLGNGLKAVFNMEWWVDIAGQGRDLGPRQRFVGLASGQFGTLTLGRIHSPMKKIGLKTDLFYNSQLGESRDIKNRDGLPQGPESLGMDPFLDNTIEYITPRWNGLFVDFAYSTDYDVPVDNGRDDNDFDAYSVALNYENGPIFAGAAYDARNSDAATRTFNQAWRFTGSYKFQQGFRLVGLVQEGYEIGGVAGQDRLTWGVGAGYKFGNNNLKGHFYQAQETSDNADNGAYQISVGFDHNLSKRTMVYATYSRIENDANATFRLGSSGFDDTQNNVVPGADPQGFSVGLRHLF
jgi:predicted porin